MIVSVLRYRTRSNTEQPSRCQAKCSCFRERNGVVSLSFLTFEGFEFLFWPTMLVHPQLIESLPLTSKVKHSTPTVSTNSIPALTLNNPRTISPNIPQPVQSLHPVTQSLKTPLEISPSLPTPLAKCIRGRDDLWMFGADRPCSWR
jgi:hypothetical protein